MLGFIKKDLLTMMSNSKIFILMLLLFLIMSMTEEGSSSFLPSFVGVMLVLTTFSYDEQSKWDCYAITLPNGRKNVVKSKYWIVIILSIFSFLLTLVTYILTDYVKQVPFDIIGDVKESLVIVTSIYLFLLVMCPIIFKLGIAKARIAFVFVYGLFIAIIYGLSQMDSDIIVKIVDFVETYSLFSLALLCVIFSYISYKISERIYLKKSF